jgi:glycosyltransferase involved in cell wall biosynthesis
MQMKAFNPLVTVIIPTWNRKELLAEAVGSVVEQSFRDYEIIIVDDGSTDGTKEFCEDFAEQFGAEKLRYLGIPHCGKPGAVRNRGAEKARGCFLAFLDSDDLWTPEKLQLQVDWLVANPDIKFLHTREKWLRQGKVVSQRKMKFQREGWVFKDALQKCTIGPSTVMIERSLYEETGGFREDLEIAEDYEYWLRVTSRFPVGYLDVPLTIKRAGFGDHLSEKYEQIEIFRMKGLQDLVERDFLEGEFKMLAALELTRKYSIYTAGCRKRGKIAEAGHYDALVNDLRDKSGS